VVGAAVGIRVGDVVGAEVGCSVGTADGANVGTIIGATKSTESVGAEVGCLVRPTSSSSSLIGAAGPAPAEAHTRLKCCRYCGVPWVNSAHSVCAPAAPQGLVGLDMSTGSTAVLFAPSTNGGANSLGPRTHVRNCGW
jgi:hypothetical protein